MSNRSSASQDLCCPGLFEGVLEEAQADEFAGILKVVADPVRLRLLSILAAATSGEVCACDLPALLGRSQPTVSHHLSQLTAAGIVDREQRGKWAWFRLRSDRFEAIAAALAPRASSPTRTGSPNAAVKPSP